MPLMLASTRWDHRELGPESTQGRTAEHTEVWKRRNSSQHSEDGEKRRRRSCRWKCALLKVGVLLLGSGCLFSFQNRLTGASPWPHSRPTFFIRHPTSSKSLWPTYFHHYGKSSGGAPCMGRCKKRKKKAAKQKASCHAHTKTNPPVSVDCMRAMLFLRAITSQSSLCDHHIPTDGNAIVQ